jgi:hypothetical protein
MSGNSVVREHFLRQRLVAGEQKSPRVATRVGSSLKLQVSDDVCIEDCLISELFEQIEHHVRLEILDRRPKWRQLIAQPDQDDFVPEQAQPFAHVELGLERLDFCFRKLADVPGRDEAVVHEHDNPPSL